MKRIITVFAILLIALLCFASCKVTNGPVASVETDPTFIKLNELVANTDNNFDLNITVLSQNGMKTTYNYQIRENGSQKTVHQRSESINHFIINNGEIKAPESYSTVTEKDLSANEIKFGKFDFPAFKFSSQTLGTYTELGSNFQCKIKSLRSFTNFEIVGTDGYVEVVYNETAISSITITYTSAKGSHVTLEYVIQ